MRIGFTDHAVDRYIQFHTDPEVDPKPTRDEIRAILDGAAPNAVRLKEKTCRGDTQWRIEALGIVCVTKPDRNAAGMGEHVCVTILPPHRDLNGMTVYEMEIVEAKLEEIRIREEELRKQQPKVIERASKIEKMPKEMFEKLPLDKGETLELLRARLAELKKKLELVLHEKAILNDYFKTIRTAVSNDQTVVKQREALKIAMRFLQARGAEDVIREINRIDPSFARFEFYKESA